MKRIMMLMAVAAMMVTMMAVWAGPASAATAPNPSCGNPPVPAGTDERGVSRPQDACYNPTAEEPAVSGPNPNDNSVASQVQGLVANSFGLANSILGNTIGSLGGLPTIPDPANSGGAPANSGSAPANTDERSVTRPQSAIPDPANSGSAPANTGSSSGGGGSGMGGSIFNHQGSLH